MVVSRDTRTSRRRRVIRSDAEQDKRKTTSKRKTATAEERRRAGYSHDVRRACGLRLVGLIPVRATSFMAVLFVSLAFPALLMLGHYMIYVSGSLPWYGHPLAVSLDASHANSLASWFSSHLWLLCLAATVLTFQIRQHKLDDYAGEYRLWFWLVFTCLLASIDAATHLSELLGLALTPWSQRTLGWTGPAVVKATVATLVGLLGLRLCTELKSVPLSLIFWLTGLFAWAGSAALDQEELRLEMSLQLRVFLKAALWLGGLTAVWLSAITYLRHVYIEAQQRFLARSRRNGTSFTQRIREKLPRGRRERIEDDDEEGRGWKLPGFGWRRRQEEEEEEQERETSRRRKTKSRRKKSEDEEEEYEEERNTRSSRQSRKKPTTSSRRRDEIDEEEEELEAPRRRSGLGGFFGRRSREDQTDEFEGREREEAEEEDNSRRGGLFGWFSRGESSEDEEADEYRKLDKDQRAREREEKRAERQLLKEEKARQRAELKEQREAEKQAAKDEGGSGGWFSWGRKRDEEEESAEDDRRSRRSDEDEEESESRGWFGRRKRNEEEADEADSPKRKGFFSRFRLQPPDDEADDGGDESEIRSVDRDRNMPTTDEYDDDDEPERPMSRAERKRQRKKRRAA